MEGLLRLEHEPLASGAGTVRRCGTPKTSEKTQIARYYLVFVARKLNNYLPGIAPWLPRRGRPRRLLRSPFLQRAFSPCLVTSRSSCVRLRRPDTFSTTGYVLLVPWAEKGRWISRVFVLANPLSSLPSTSFERGRREGRVALSFWRRQSALRSKGGFFKSQLTSQYRRLCSFQD